MTNDKPYSTAIQWLLLSPHSSLVTPNGADRLQAIGTIFDQLASIKGHKTELGFERHNDESDRVDFFARGGTEMLRLKGVDYPRWRDAIINQSRQQGSPGSANLFPPFFYLEFDESCNGYRLAGIFQTSWLLRSLDASAAQSAISDYLEKTELYSQESLRHCSCLKDFIRVFGPPCSFGIMDRNKNAVKIAAHIKSVAPSMLKGFITRHFQEVFSQESEQIADTVSAITESLRDRPIMISLDIDVSTNKYFPRFSFELNRLGGKATRGTSSVAEYIAKYNLERRTQKCIDANTKLLPFGYRRKCMLTGRDETLYGWHNHEKITIQRDGVKCKSYFGLSYIENHDNSSNVLP